MFAEYVSWVIGTWHKVETNVLGVNCFPNTMEGQGCMPFVQLGMGDGR